MMKLAAVFGAIATASAQCGPDDVQSVQDACCPVGTQCTDDLPATCSGACTSEFLDFYVACQDLIAGAGAAAQFDHFASLCRNPLQGCTSSAQCGAYAECVPRMGCTMEPCSDCLCESGYVGDGHNCAVAPPPPAPPAPSNLSNGPANQITTDGNPASGEVDEGVADIYVFGAVMGNTYQIVVELGSLSDSIVELWASDRATYIDSNDDANGGLGSELDWTATSSGAFYIAVRGYAGYRGSYTLYVTEQAAAGGACGSSSDGQPPMLTLHESGDIDFTDDTYLDGQVCSWLVDCRGGRLASIRFASFSTETNYDWLDIYDGPDDSGAQQAHISGSMDDGTGSWQDGTNQQAVQNYHASGSQMLLRFTSDQSVRGGGFSFTYDCSANNKPITPAVVPLTLNQATPGSITQPGTYAAYTFTAQPNTDYTLSTELIAAAGNIALEDSVIEVYSSRDMTVDPVAMNDDGPENPTGAPHNTASYLEFSPQVSTPTVFYVRVRGFSTDQTGDFTLTVATSGGGGGACAANGRSLSDSGSISFTDGYQNSVDCKWTINCPAGKVARVQFTDFDTETGYDFVRLYDGANAQASNLASLSGQTMPEPDTYRSTGQSLFIEFTADSSVLGGGFGFDYSCQTSGPTPNQAPSATTCTPVRIGSDRPTAGHLETEGEVQYFCLDATASITYDITVNLGSGTGSLTDSIVDVYASNQGWPVDALVHNDDANGGLASRVQFTPDLSGLYFVAVKGFGTNTGDFELVIASSGDSHDSEPCKGGSTLSSEGGVVTFSAGDYPGQAGATCSDACTCDWSIQCADGTHPSITFASNFQTEAHWDFLKLYDGFAANPNTEIANFTGAIATPTGPIPNHPYTASNSRMLVEFTSDPSVSSENVFEFVYSCIEGADVSQCSPAGTLVVNTPITGQVQSNPSPSNLPGAACFSFQASAGNDYQFTVTLGTLTDSVLMIKDATGRQVGYNDDAGDGSLASYLDWHADTTGTYSVVVAGYGTSTGSFTLAVATGVPCSGDGVGLPGDGGSLSYLPDSGTADNLDCQWHISCSGSNDVVHLTFTAFDTEGGWDFVDIFDGSSVGDSTTIPIAHLSGGISGLDAITYSSRSPQMTIHFTTDGSQGQAGFAADYECGDCEGSGCAGNGCVDHIDELSGPNACSNYLAVPGYSCDTSFCETCQFAHMCDYTCGLCAR